MKSKYFLSILILVLVVFLVSCGVSTPSVNLTGNWTFSNLTTSSTTSHFPIGEVSKATCNMIDNYGSLTIYNFKSFGQEYINWGTGYGTFNNPIITGKISGSYKNVYGQTVTNVINHSGTITPNGHNGSGNWSQTISVSGYFDTASGTTSFIIN